MMRRLKKWGACTAGIALLLLGTPLAANAAPTGLSAAPATASELQECTALVGFDFANTVITSAELVSAGVVTNAGTAVGEHCVVEGHMNERVSEVDGKTYRIGFEMRLPTDWAGRYLYQANGGIDGSVAPAMGSFTGGQLETGLQQGFAVISSDAGHDRSQNPTFGMDPQARLDYGYQAVGTLTPMAKALIEAGYGRGPDTSYIAGGSNGGRHTMVAAARYADMYDGFFAIAPGFNLPQAAVAQIWGAQQWNAIATTPGDLESALSPEERTTVAEAILEQCDAVDGLADGMVQDSAQCQELFNVQDHVPTCDTERDGTCLTPAQKDVLERVFAGAVTSSGEPFYSSFPYDAGIANSGWASWKFNMSITRDPSAVAYIFNTPPTAPTPNDAEWALNSNIDELAAAIWTKDDVYTESGMEFMTPPDPTELESLRANGGKLLVVHGASDGVFSPDDTAAWYDGLTENYGAETPSFARYFEVPGMSHVRGGAATDQFDGLGAIIDWVENGIAPDRIEATARGAGNPGGVNDEVPADWAPDRTRPLCAYPAVATYVEGDPESATSFECLTATIADPDPDPDPEPEPEPGPEPDSGPVSPDPTPGTGDDQSTDEADDAQGRKNLATTGGSEVLPLIALGVITLATGGTLLLSTRKAKKRAQTI